MMMAFYSLIFVASTAFASWAGERIFTRVLREMNAPDSLSQLMVVLAALGFLMVVAAPTAWIVGAFLVMMLGAYSLKDLQQTPFTPPALLGLSIASLLGVYGLVELHADWPAGVPAAVFWFAAFAAWMVLLVPAQRVQPNQWIFSAAVIVSAAPVTIAPLLFPSVHSSIALDVGILTAALLGGILSPYAAQPATAMLRLSSAFILVGLIVATAYYGAWPMAAASAVIWAVCLMLMHRHPVFDVAEGEQYA